MSQRGAQKERSRQSIVAAASVLLRESGIEGTTVGAAMKGAGLTVGAFYAHFADKDEMVAEAFQRALEESEALIDDAAVGLHGVAAVRAAVERYLSETHRDDVRRGCPLPATLGEASADESVAMRSMLAAGLVVMARRLLVISEGSLTDDQAHEVATLMVGGQIVARAVRGTPLSSATLASYRAACDTVLGRTATYAHDSDLKRTHETDVDASGPAPPASHTRKRTPKHP